MVVAFDVAVVRAVVLCLCRGRDGGGGGGKIWGACTGYSSGGVRLWGVWFWSMSMSFWSIGAL